ncbi:MAG TPA: DUF883 C-terminal domain-containing protein [Pirellulales bacterium]|jgi:ElaB/YqjD/DUF883 family membrane-anchored ribosome-binding protein|nr:DUF883 C-terminal domain-containing protein [Pirellulales bacterium]
MFRSDVKDRKATKNSNHTLRNGSNGKGYGAETERNVLTAVRELSSDATQSMKRRAAEFKDSAADYISKSRKKVRAMRKSTKQQVKQNPKAALCIAAGIGLLAGICLRRRK